MKRLSLLLLFLVALSAAAKKSELPAELLQAKSVVVTVYPESGNTVASSFNRPPIGEDLRVIREVETAIKGWGRWKVVSTMNEADLVIAVRQGRIGTASVEFPVPPPNGESKEVSLTAEIGSPEDVIAIYSAGTVVDTGSNRHNFDAPIWRRVQANALEAPYMRGIQQLRKEIEKAEAK